MPLELHPIFGDGAVLQRGVPVRVHGRASAHEILCVLLGKEGKEIVAKANGEWEVVFGPRQVGDAGSFEVVSKNERLTRSGWLWGEIWIGAGQSNMAFALEKCAGHAAPWWPLGADAPQVRLFKCHLTMADQPRRVLEGRWVDSSAPDFAAKCGAVPAYFARRLSYVLKVPVGVIQNAWGGIAAEAWLPQEVIEQDPRLAPYREQRAAALKNVDVGLAEYRSAMHSWYEACPQTDRGKCTKQEYERAGMEEGWSAVARPFIKSKLLPPGEDGSVWFRARCDTPKEWAIAPVTIAFGLMDAQVQIWVNGYPILQRDDGTPFFWLQPLSGVVPEGILTSGRAEILVRCLYRFCEGNDMADGVPALVGPDGQRCELLDWEGKPGIGLPAPAASLDGPPRPWPKFQVPWDVHAPSRMFNALVAPLSEYSVWGVIWYQGESNTGRAEQYASTLKCLIEQWRIVIGQPVPFGIVQIARFGSKHCPNAGSGSARLRAAQAEVAEHVPGVGMVTAIHLGEEGDVHPRNKAPVGMLLADWALDKVYGRTAEAGPWRQTRLLKAQVQGSAVDLVFDRPVKIIAGQPAGFGLAGPDGVEFPADAILIGECSVRVSCREIAKPSLVSLDWADCPPCALRDLHGLPPISFRIELNPE